MAEDTVDKVLIQLGRIGEDVRKYSDSISRHHKLMGTLPLVEKAVQLPESSVLVEWYAELIGKYHGLEVSVCKQLVRTYGVRSFQILALID